MIKELSLVVLTRSIPEYSLVAGEILRARSLGQIAQA